MRLGGLHALERLAQNNPAQRQTIVDVICAYLRMPYTPPDEQAPGEDAPQDAQSRYEQCRQELQVRVTAQRILTAHLDPDEAVFWENIDLDLTEAYLHQLNLTDCHIGRARFAGATFAGDTWLSWMTFTQDAWFDEATFAGDVSFNQTTGHHLVMSLDGARVSPSRRVKLPIGWITRAAQPAEGEEDGWLYVVRDEDSAEQPAEAPDDGPA